MCLWLCTSETPLTAKRTTPVSIALAISWGALLNILGSWRWQCASNNFIIACLSLSLSASHLTASANRWSQNTWSPNWIVYGQDPNNQNEPKIWISPAQPTSGKVSSLCLYSSFFNSKKGKKKKGDSFIWMAEGGTRIAKLELGGL